MTEFDAKAYSGKWYEIVRDSTNPYTIGADCVTKEFSPFDEKTKSMDTYFRGFYHASQSYKGVDGTMYDCGQSTDKTCI